MLIDPRRLWSSPNLPTLPAAAVRLLKLSKDPETEILDIIAVIKTDPALVAKVLKSANSSFFGFSSRITSIERAVPLLGQTVVTSLALSFSLAESAMATGALAGHFRNYWLHSVVQAAATEMLKEHAGAGLDCECFLAGLLLDVGRLAMLKTIPKEYTPVLDAAEKWKQELHVVESELLGIDHVEVGVKLMENWNLPPAMVDGVRYHHAPVNQVKGCSALQHFQLIKAVSVGSAVGDYFCGADKATAFERLKCLTRELYGLSGSDLDQLLNRTKARIDETAELFSVSADDLLQPGDLMALANEQLAQLAMREHVASAQAVARQQAIEQEKRELESKNRDLEKRALYDPLTRIYNRLFFDEALQREVDRCSRIAAPLGVIFADVDNFKVLNDTYGHQFGDQVLAAVAKTCGTVLRKADVLARYGGEEFVVLLSEPTEKGIMKVAERLRQAVELQQIYFGTQRVPVTVSVGAALALPERDTDGIDKRLMQAADEAMYDAKQRGRNQVCLRSLLDDRERRLAQLVTSRKFSRWLVSQRIFDIPAISSVLLRCWPSRERIGLMAQQQKFLNLHQVDQIMEEQERSGRRFGAVAVDLGLLTDEHVAQLLALQQEDPRALAKQLIGEGLLDQQHAHALLGQYLAETGLSARATEEHGSAQAASR
jgi:diguanylate cyclase (GGDEF)-like protein